MDFFQQISNQYEEAWKNIIQPQRQHYSEDNLGPWTRPINNSNVLRRELEILNKRGQKLKCSYFHAQGLNQSDTPCIIYLHGNAGSRIQALSTLRHLLPEISLVCFDFSGSGKSEGSYVTMGINESEDLESVVNYLRSNYGIQQFGFWGRSMGAVTALLYASKFQYDAECLILDSPFTQLSKVTFEIAKSRSMIPGFVLQSVLALIKSQIAEVLGFDIFKIDLTQQILKVKCALYFVYAQDDTIIAPYHTQTLHDLYQGEKAIHQISGNHNTIRPNTYFEEIVIFARSKLLNSNQTQIQTQFVGAPTFMNRQNAFSVLTGDINHSHRNINNTSQPSQLGVNQNQSFSQENQRVPYHSPSIPHTIEGRDQIMRANSLNTFQSVADVQQQNNDTNYLYVPRSNSKQPVGFSSQQDQIPENLYYAKCGPASSGQINMMTEESERLASPKISSEIRNRVMSGINLVQQTNNQMLQKPNIPVSSNTTKNSSSQPLDSMDNVIDKCISALPQAKHFVHDEKPVKPWIERNNSEQTLNIPTSVDRNYHQKIADPQGNSQLKGKNQHNNSFATSSQQQQILQSEQNSKILNNLFLQNRPSNSQQLDINNIRSHLSPQNNIANAKNNCFVGVNQETSDNQIKSNNSHQPIILGAAQSRGNSNYTFEPSTISNKANNNVSMTSNTNESFDRDSRRNSQLYQVISNLQQDNSNQAQPTMQQQNSHIQQHASPSSSSTNNTLIMNLQPVANESEEPRRMSNYMMLPSAKTPSAVQHVGAAASSSTNTTNSIISIAPVIQRNNPIYRASIDFKPESDNANPQKATLNNTENKRVSQGFSEISTPLVPQNNISINQIQQQNPIQNNSLTLMSPKRHIVASNGIRPTSPVHDIRSPRHCPSSPTVNIGAPTFSNMKAGFGSNTKMANSPDMRRIYNFCSIKNQQSGQGPQLDSYDQNSNVKRLPEENSQEVINQYGSNRKNTNFMNNQQMTVQENRDEKFKNAKINNLRIQEFFEKRVFNNNNIHNDVFKQTNDGSSAQNSNRIPVQPNNPSFSTLAHSPTRKASEIIVNKSENFHINIPKCLRSFDNSNFNNQQNNVTNPYQHQQQLQHPHQQHQQQQQHQVVSQPQNQVQNTEQQISQQKVYLEDKLQQKSNQTFFSIQKQLNSPEVTNQNFTSDRKVSSHNIMNNPSIQQFDHIQQPQNNKVSNLPPPSNFQKPPHRDLNNIANQTNNIPAQNRVLSNNSNLLNSPQPHPITLVDHISPQKDVENQQFPLNTHQLQQPNLTEVQLNNPYNHHQQQKQIYQHQNQQQQQQSQPQPQPNSNQVNNYSIQKNTPNQLNQIGSPVKEYQISQPVIENGSDKRSSFYYIQGQNAASNQPVVNNFSVVSIDQGKQENTEPLTQNSASNYQSNPPVSFTNRTNHMAGGAVYGGQANYQEQNNYIKQRLMTPSNQGGQLQQQQHYQNQMPQQRQNVYQNQNPTLPPSSQRSNSQMTSTNKNVNYQENMVNCGFGGGYVENQMVRPTTGICNIQPYYQGVQNFRGNAGNPNYSHSNLQQGQMM